MSYLTGPEDDARSVRVVHPLVVCGGTKVGYASMERDQNHDVVVVGGGPAGVSGALECFDINLETVVLEARAALGGQVGEIPHSVRNVAVGRFEDGSDLQRALDRSAGILGAHVVLEHGVTRANLDERWVEAGGVCFRAKALLIASGSRRQIHPAAPDGTFGGDVTYQVESRADRFLGRDVVVVGGGDSATLDALELAATAKSVKLVHRSERLSARGDIVERIRADHRIETLPGWELDSIAGSAGLEEVVLVRPATGERRSVAASGLVIKISRIPETETFRGQIELDRRGAIVVDDALSTSCPGVFAAGDIVAGSYWRVATAMGQGSLAARSIRRYLDNAS
jgi:thioredoxin reductase (NADPH)